LKMYCGSRCFCPCRSGHFASRTARDFVSAAVRIATVRLAHVRMVQATPAGRRCLDCGAGLSPETNPKRLRVFRRAERLLKKAACGLKKRGREHERNSTMPNPKRRHSTRRTALRRSHDFLTAVGLSECPTCHEKKLPHRACPKCGAYKGHQVLDIKETAK
jgi:large subunit ribosomal protein L32